MLLFYPYRYVSSHDQVSGKIQCWSLKLAMYQYVLQFCLTAQHGNAAALSRLPLPESLDTVSLPGEPHLPY